MSEQPKGSGWYQAVDGRWYPPSADMTPHDAGGGGGGLRGTMGGRAAPVAPVASTEPAATPVLSATLAAGPLDDPDRFSLVQLCSRGGEGELWRGELLIDRVTIPVAIKVIHPSNAVNLAEWRTRWQRQAELLRSLDHAGLVKVRDVFEGPLPHPPATVDTSSRSLFLVMNWVDGQTLEQWVATYPERSFTDSVRLIERLAAAVDYLHSGGIGGWPIVHRDIKPANVIINGSTACLVDFGFARILSDQPMTLVGTPSYLAPEVLSRGMYSEASDRFALAGTAYFALTGRRPAPDDQAQMLAALVAVRGIEGRDDVARTFLQMLHPDPYQRPRNATEWVRSVASTAGGGRSTLSPAAPPLAASTSIGVGAARLPAQPSPQPRAATAPQVVVGPASSTSPRGASNERSLTIALAVIAIAILTLLGVLLGLVLSNRSDGGSTPSPRRSSLTGPAPAIGDHAVDIEDHFPDGALVRSNELTMTAPPTAEPIPPATPATAPVTTTRGR